ncbi:SCO4983 family protein [Streptomyces sp. KR80]|uniref:SCO4983 family protein n=1 Tax=Streptomyces sp. KR80 TaxID=3457426 RepID=UPI003FD4E33C
MYEPIRTKSVHTMAEPGYPHRSREEELDIQLAGHLAALLAVTDELRPLTADADDDLGQAADRISEQVARLRKGPRPVRSSTAAPSTAPVQRRSAAGREGRAEALHRRAHALAGRALVVAASRADTTAAILAAQRMDAHAAALDASASPALAAH